MTNHPFHITGPCEAAYARGCRCEPCRRAWAAGRRRRTGAQASKLTIEVARLTTEIARLNAEADAMELNLAALRDENAVLRCRLQEIEIMALQLAEAT